MTTLSGHHDRTIFSVDWSKDGVIATGMVRLGFCPFASTYYLQAEAVSLSCEEVKTQPSSIRLTITANSTVMQLSCTNLWKRQGFCISKQALLSCSWWGFRDLHLSSQIRKQDQRLAQARRARCTVTSLNKDTQCRDNPDERTTAMAAHHCILTAVVSLSKINLTNGQISG